LIQNLHTHTNFSDGSDDPVKYIEEALRQGFSILGFSDHSPLPFENKFALREEQTDRYCKTIIDLRKKLIFPSPSQAINIQHPASNIQLFLGMETDFISGLGHSPAYFKENFPLDYIIGSVHLVRNPQEEELWFIDGPLTQTYDDGLSKVFHGDSRFAVTTYYRQVQEMIACFKPDIVGHLDKIKMHNHDRFFSETELWYNKLVDETLDLIQENGCIVEVNTRGIYKKRSETLFPGPAILKKILSRKIPVTLCSDAHKPNEISMFFPEAIQLLTNLGFHESMYLSSAGWESHPFK